MNYEKNIVELIRKDIYENAGEWNLIQSSYSDYMLSNSKKRIYIISATNFMTMQLEYKSTKINLSLLDRINLVLFIRKFVRELNISTYNNTEKELYESFKTQKDN